MKKATDRNPVYVMSTVATIFASAVFLLCCIEISPLGVVFSSSNTSMLPTSDTSNTTSTPTGDVLNTKYLEITNHTFSEDLLFTIVNGTLINNLNNTINSAEVTVQFYDANGTLITSSTENAKFIILAPGENSSYSVRSDLGDEITSKYKVIPGGDIEVG
ncbi:MAG: hypothetical protein GEU26_16950 [Nitrososphaeraceae archaeon]|nr:hypothetical protein [Nitrososphaeraceae archaeon]